MPDLDLDAIERELAHMRREHSEQWDAVLVLEQLDALVAEVKRLRERLESCEHY